MKEKVEIILSQIASPPIVENTSTPKMAQKRGPESQVQRQIQQDWANREYIEVITTSIKKITDFLNSFGGF